MPHFLITIDTEGDNLWAKPRDIETRNSAYLPRFQSLCEKHGFKPTYLTNYEMAKDGFFVEFAKDTLARGLAEVGMHLHAWNSPPITPLTHDDYTCQPYLIEYPEPVMRDKVRFMTDLLEDAFGMKMLSHRAGRWGMDSRYARLLVEYGYRVDCSVTPHMTWQPHKGDPSKLGGTNYLCYPEHAYFFNLDDLKRPGNSELLELPMTVINDRHPIFNRLRNSFSYGTFMRKVIDRLFPRTVRWLMPNGKNVREMQQIVLDAAEMKRPYIELALHSSELMPGGSPIFQTEREIEILYEHLEQLFETIRAHFPGSTLKEYYSLVKNGMVELS